MHWNVQWILVNYYICNLDGELKCFIPHDYANSFLYSIVLFQVMSFRLCDFLYLLHIHQPQILVHISLVHLQFKFRATSLQLLLKYDIWQGRIRPKYYFGCNFLHFVNNFTSIVMFKISVWSVGRYYFANKW